MLNEKACKSWHRAFFPTVAGIIAVFLMTYLVLSYLGFTFSTQPHVSIGDISKWCERVSNSVFREPVNTLSNLGYVLSGLLMVRVLSVDSAKGNSGSQFHGITPVAILYSLSTVYLGVGSMLMHGTQTLWGAWADNLSMVMYILTPWLINVATMGKWTNQSFFRIYLTIVTTYAIARWILGPGLGVNFDLFDLSIGLWVISEVLFRFWSPLLRWVSGFIGFFVATVFGIMPWEIVLSFWEYWWVILFWLPAILSPTPPTTRRVYAPWFFAGMFSFLLAFILWQQGTPGTPYCDPDSLLQPHAFWHILTAVSTWCFFQSFRTERNLVNPR